METAQESAASFVIRCTDIPNEFIADKNVAKRYFRRFGRVKGMTFKSKQKICIVEYWSEEGMLNALEIAGEHMGKSFNVAREKKSPSKKKKAKKGINPDPEWVPDPEVIQELEAMGSPFSHSYNLRPEQMAVDVVVETPKSSKLKSLKKVDSPRHQQKKQPTTETNYDLESLLQMQAVTVEDRYRILDARDKLIRLKQKNLVLPKATTKGTCPDMCPEKERLMREVQHQVALYEQAESGREMNPRLAVKQYSRSSADQEAPLPQELRPVAILQMTMGYLMHKIIGLCDSSDVNVGEWYHFLWDRTRGIRKDITQQELCCQGSVELVEQCARFHIFCSARLVAEDPSVFDQKINTENLTKCLQTLKYMYSDLRLKGESCRNEPEFRAYIILLNLNDGNFMWEVQQLKREIQQSLEVRFALDVYSSLDKNNYVKFFKLVKSTTYLNACILMRYFIQVRISALNTFLKCYSLRAANSILPLSNLIKVLGFEDQETAIEFLNSYGLYTNQENTHLILDKKSFSMPEFPFVLDRAINLIESKRTVSIGEVVCGRELPPKIYETHVPQNSFDESGFLKPEHYKSFQNEVVPKRAVVEPPSVNSPSVVIQQQKNIFGQTTWNQNIFGGIRHAMAPPKIDEEAELKKQREEELRRKEEELRIVQRKLQEKIKSELEEKQRRIEEEKRRLMEEERRKELKRKEEEAARRAEIMRREEERQKQMEEKRHQQLRAIKLEEMRLERLKKEKEEEEAKKVVEARRVELEIKRTVTSVMESLLSSVEFIVRNQKLTEISNKLHKEKLRKVIEKWREYMRRKRKRKALEFSPIFPKLSLREEAEQMRMHSQNLALSYMKRYKMGSPIEVTFTETPKTQVVDLARLTHDLLIQRNMELNQKIASELFWKITISVPSNDIGGLESNLNSFLKWNDKYLIQQSTKSGTSITYCLEKQKGTALVEKSDSNGLIFIGNDFDDSLSQRILLNLKNYGVLTQTPVVLILQNYDENKRPLAHLIEEGIVSDYLILIDRFSYNRLISMLEEALIFLAKRLEKVPPLLINTLKDFLSCYLCNDIWKKALSFSKWNSNYKTCLQNPNTTIYIYNEAVDRLKKIILNRACGEYLRFPEVFKQFLRSEIPSSLPNDYKYFPSFWDSPSYLQYISDILNKFNIPQLPPLPTTELELERVIYSYCKRVFEKDIEKCFYKLMAVLLNNSLKFDGLNFVDVILNEKLAQTNFTLYGTGFANKSIYNQLVIVYDSETLNEFCSDWFYINHPVIRQQIIGLLREGQKKVSRSKPRCNTLDMDATIGRALKVISKRSPKINEKLKGDLRQCKNLVEELEDSFCVHKRILAKSGSMMNSILKEEHLK